MTRSLRIVRYTYALGWILFVVAIVYRVAIDVYNLVNEANAINRVIVHPRSVLVISAMMFLISIATAVHSQFTTNTEGGERKSRAAGA